MVDEEEVNEEPTEAEDEPDVDEGTLPPDWPDEDDPNDQAVL